MFDQNDPKWKNPENLSGPIVPGHPDYVAPTHYERKFPVVKPRDPEATRDAHDISGIHSGRYPH